MFDTRKLQGENRKLKINLTDGAYIIGKIVSVDDEEDSGLGEPGVTILTPEGVLSALETARFRRSNLLNKTTMQTHRGFFMPILS